MSFDVSSLVVSDKRQAVITIGLYQFVGTVEECFAVDELMHKLSEVTNHWVHDEKDNFTADPLPDNYWTIASDPRNIKLEFLNRDVTVIHENDGRHQEHIKNRKARWEKEEEQLKDEYSDES